MLLKNGQIHQLADTDLDSLRKRFPKFPVVLKIRDQFFQMSNDPENKRATNPSIELPLSAIVYGDKGQETWTYCESRVPDAVRPNAYNVTPTRIPVPNRLILDKKEIELLWFLTHCSPLVLNNEVKQKSSVVYFEFEDKAMEARSEVEKIRLEGFVRKRLYSEKQSEVASDEEVRTMAEAFAITNVSTKDPEEVRLELFKKATSSTMQMEEFRKLSVGSITTNTQALVTRAMEHRVVMVHTTRVGSSEKTCWYFTDENKQPAEKICEIMPKHRGNKQRESLIEALADQELYDRMHARTEAAQNKVEEPVA